METKQSISSSKLQSPVALLDSAINLYKKRFVTLFIITSIPSLLSIISWLVTPLFKTSGISILISVLLGIISVVAIFWSELALIFSIKEKTGIEVSYKKSFGKVLSYFWLMILSFFIIAGGFLLFVIPGIIFAVWFAFASYILVYENTGGINALLKSKEYVKGQWFSILWRLIVIFIFYFVTYLSLTFLTGLLGLPVAVKTIVTYIISSIIGPIIPVYLLLLYENLKEIKGDFSTVKNSRVIYYIIGAVGFLIIPGSILAAVALIAIDPIKQYKKASDNSRVYSIKQIQAGLEMYKIEKGSYPLLLSDMQGAQIKIVPLDPKTKQPYKYQIKNNGTDYEICADFEARTPECFNSQKTVLPKN